MKGCIQVYTGNGKGKTTAAFGLAMRAAGAGMKVFIGQFLKGSDYSELTAIQRFSDTITLEQFGKKGFIRNNPQPVDIELAQNGLKKIEAIISESQYNVIILDEINIAVYYKLVSPEQLLAILKKRNEATEIVLTGRYANPLILEYADLVTEMKNVKHYFEAGIPARPGIEK